MRVPADLDSSRSRHRSQCFCSNLSVAATDLMPSASGMLVLSLKAHLAPCPWLPSHSPVMELSPYYLTRPTYNGAGVLTGHRVSRITS